MGRPVLSSPSVGGKRQLLLVAIAVVVGVVIVVLVSGGGGGVFRWCVRVVECPAGKVFLVWVEC